MCIKFKFFRTKLWKDPVTIKCCLLLKERRIFFCKHEMSCSLSASRCVCSISRHYQRLRKLQGLYPKISAIRKVLTFVMSIWLNSQFSANLATSSQNSSVPVTGGPTFATLEMRSKFLPSPSVRRWLKHCSSSSSLVPGCSCPGEIVSPVLLPEYWPNSCLGYSQAQRKKKKISSLPVAFCQAAIPCILQGTVEGW